MKRQLIGNPIDLSLRRSCRLRKHPYQFRGALIGLRDKSSYRLLAERLKWFNDLPEHLFIGIPSKQVFKE